MGEQVQDMSYMFAQATRFQGGDASVQELPSIAAWDVSRVQNMDSMFSGATKFNIGLGTWQLSSLLEPPNSAWLHGTPKLSFSDFSECENRACVRQNRACFDRCLCVQTVLRFVIESCLCVREQSRVARFRVSGVDFRGFGGLGCRV